MDRLNRIASSMMGAEIDFIVRGIDKASRSVVASRRAAMLRKRQTFYMDVSEATGALWSMRGVSFKPGSWALRKRPCV